MPKISVIIPVYNVEKYLRECLDSVINQTLKDIEIICINDGSTDKSLEILQEYENKDNRFILISQFNQGQGNARNIGLNISRGEYVLFLEPDDYYTDNTAFEKLYSCAIENNAKMIHFNYLIKHEDKGIIEQFSFAEHLKELYNYDLYTAKYYNWKKFSKGWMSQCDVHAWIKLYKGNFLKENKICYSPGKFGEDHYFVIQTLIYADKIYYIDKFFYCYRIRSDSSCHKKTLEALNFFDYLDQIEKFLKENGIWSDLENEFTDYRENIIQTIFVHTPANATNKFKKKLSKYVNNRKEYKQLCKILRLNNFWQQIFSVKNEYSNNIKHKVITILGIKIKFKVKNT